MDKFTFFDLRVYKEAKLLVKEVYSLMDKFPKYETYALSDQLRRAVVSVPSNIAEGAGRFSIKENPLHRNRLWLFNRNTLPT